MRILFVGIIALSLAACAKPVKIVTAIPADVVQNMSLQTVHATYSPQAQERLAKLDQELSAKAASDPHDAKKNPDNYEAFKAVLPRVLKSRLQERGLRGSQNVSLEIKIDTLKLADPGMAFLIGDMDQLSAFVYVKDAATKKLIGEYYVDAIVGKGGIIGAATSGLAARRRLAVTFADHFADQLGLHAVKSEYKANEN